jgi:hypothetical protein
MAAVDDLVNSGFEGRDLVFCTDGPRAGAWYFLDWWKEQRRLAEWGHETPLVGSTLGYIATRQTQPHPRHGGVQGRILRWDPKQAARSKAAS